MLYKHQPETMSDKDFIELINTFYDAQCTLMDMRAQTSEWWSDDPESKEYIYAETYKQYCATLRKFPFLIHMPMLSWVMRRWAQ